MLHTDDTDPTTVQEGYAALRDLLGFNDPERPAAPKPSDLAVLKAAIKALRDTKREQAGLTRLSDPTAPGWRDLDYEEPPLREPVLLKTEDGEIFIGTFEGYGTADDVEDSNINEDTIQDEADDTRDAPVFFQDAEHYDGDAPLFWSYLPTYDYDDLTSDADADTAEESDDSEVFYRDIDDPPPVDVPVLLLMHNTTSQPKEPFIGWITKDGAYFTEDMDGERQEVDAPDYWSFLPRLPALDSDS